MDKIFVYFLLLSSTTVFAQNDNNPCEGDQLVNTSGECVDPCEGDQIKNIAGDCVDPDISRNIYVFAAPNATDKDDAEDKEVIVPKPKLEYNIVFVRAPEGGAGSKPIVVPPPQQKTIVYVLSKKNKAGKQPIIEVPAPPKHKPEVYYVNYVDGENPVLPGGVDLKTALDTEAKADKPKEGGDEVSPTPVTDNATVTEATPTTGYSVPEATTKPATGYSVPEATTKPAAPTGGYPQPPVAVGGASQTPTGGTPQSPANLIAQPQLPHFFFVTPQPSNIFISPQGGLGSFQPQSNFQPQGGLGNFQLLGFPAAQG